MNARGVRIEWGWRGGCSFPKGYPQPVLFLELNCVSYDTVPYLLISGFSPGLDVA